MVQYVSRQIEQHLQMQNELPNYLLQVSRN